MRRKPPAIPGLPLRLLLGLAIGMQPEPEVIEVIVINSDDDDDEIQFVGYNPPKSGSSAIRALQPSQPLRRVKDTYKPASTGTSQLGSPLKRKASTSLNGNNSAKKFIVNVSTLF